jgi:D-beta-D-heptose 7-phosphate kinase / D-beta-D-heptose 1-phosphate adenosyltransferase
MSLPNQFSRVAVLCVGDVMLDRFVGGTVRRISPESPVPVLSMADAKVLAGGAANVARNIAALGGRCTLIGVVGTDTAASDLAAALRDPVGITPRLVSIAGRPTTEKTRFVAHGQHMLRADREVTAPIDAATEAALLAMVEAELATHQVLVLSDYAKGVLTDRLVSEAIRLADRAGVSVVVDPKSPDATRYRSARVITPNLQELRQASGIDPDGNHQTVAAATRVRDISGIGAILVTRADKGMTLVDGDAPALHIPARARQVADVVGAGDTVVATLALAIGAGGSLGEAATLANAAAGIVVGKQGTATVSRAELTSEIEAAYGRGVVPSSVKVYDWAAARDAVAGWRRDGLKVGFTNGCFDLLHVGHLALLEFSRMHCDRLIVGVNADASVRRLKGPERPINTERDRARMLASLAVVDAVVVFDEDTPFELISALEPDVLVKGADYQLSQIVGADLVMGRGGEVLRFELVPDRSTSAIIAKARQ